MGKVSAFDIEHLAELTKLQVDAKEKKYFEKQFGETVGIIEKFGEVETEGLEETSQVTGLTNVLREDRVDASLVLSQEQALGNAKRVHNGFFVVKAVIDNEE